MCQRHTKSTRKTSRSFCENAQTNPQGAWISYSSPSIIGFGVEPSTNYASSGAVLVVDDETDIRRTVNSALSERGYSVFAADSGDQALRLFKKHGNEITLLLADVISTGMSGPMLADQLLESQPHIKVLFMSGSHASQVVHHFVLERGFRLLRKPFSTEELLRAVEESIGPPHRAMHGD
jgi:CheY-like chemotaxis protein